MTSTVWLGAQTLDSQDSSNVNNNIAHNNKETTSPGSFGSLVWSLVSRWMTLGRHSSPHEHDDHTHTHTHTCTCTCGQTHSMNLSLDLLQPINAAITHLSESQSHLHNQAVSADLETFHAGLVRHSICTPAEIHLALVYARRLQQRRSGCETSEKVAPVSLGPAAWVALVLLACKQLQDEPYDNSAFARLADMSLTSLNRLELALLVALDYRLSAQSDELLCLACALAPQ